MYIRNSRGQLVWIPSQDSIQAAQMTLKAVQQNTRHQMQRDEWMRFNAPPAEDNLRFDDQFSVYEGSLSNGYHNLVPPNNLNAIGNNGNMMYQGQQPHNGVDPPIPQVIHSMPALPVTHQNSGVPRVVHSTPAFPGNGQSTGVPRVIHPAQGLSSGPRQINGIPRVIHSTQAPSGPPQNSRNRRVSHPMPSLSGHRQITGLHRGIHSPPQPSGPSQNAGIPQVIHPPTEISGPTQHAGIPRVMSLASPSGPSHTTGTDRYSPIMKPPEASKALHLPAQNNMNVIGEETVHIPPENTNGDEVEEESIYDPSRHKMNVVEEEFIPDRSCMSSIFGTSIGLYNYKLPSRKEATMNCNALNITISSSDEDDIGSRISKSFSVLQKNGNFLECSGVRGSGKMFDYSGENKSAHLNAESDSKSFASRTTREELSFATSKDTTFANRTTREEHSIGTSRDTFQVDDKTRTLESKHENERKLEENLTQKSFREDKELQSLTSSHRGSMASYSSMNVVDESQKLSREDTDIHSLPSSQRENMGSYSSMIAVGELGSIVEETGSVDRLLEETGSVDRILAMEDEMIQTIMEKAREDNTKQLPGNLDEVKSKKEEQNVIPSKVGPPEDNFLAQLIKKNESFKGIKIQPVVAYSKTEGNENSLSNKSDTKAVDDYNFQDYPSFDEHPSFDEPAKPKINVDINVQQSAHTSPSVEGHSEGENTQRNANILPPKEKVSVSKRYMLKSRTARRDQIGDEL